MANVTVLYRSSVGKKLLMAVTGLFLITFLIEHLIGNLLLLKPDGGSLYNAYAEFMSSNFIIRTIEIGLFAGFIGHIVLGAKLWLDNRRVRPQGYRMNKASENTTLPARIAFVSGSIVFIFLVVHLRTFFIPSRFGTAAASMYELVRAAFTSPAYVAFYLLALVLLAYHLRHGFQSSFQTLGWRVGRYKTFIEAVGVIIWFIIPLGYAVLPVFFLWKHFSGN